MATKLKNGRYGKTGTIRYFKDGLLHREDGPAVEWPNGDKEWFFEGKRHNENGPAVIAFNGDKFWFIHGKFIKALFTDQKKNNGVHY